ncbi:MAG: hypothetical protein AAGM38_09935 [Pseudomonadota bacterium]
MSSAWARLAAPVAALGAALGLSGCVVSETLLLEDVSSARHGLPATFAVETPAGPIGVFARDTSGAYREIVDLDGAAPFALPGRHYLEPWATGDFAPRSFKLLHAACAAPGEDCGYSMLVGRDGAWTQFVVNLKSVDKRQRSGAGAAAARRTEPAAAAPDLDALKDLYLAAALSRPDAEAQSAALQVYEFAHRKTAYIVQTQPVRLRMIDAHMSDRALAALGDEPPALRDPLWREPARQSAEASDAPPVGEAERLARNALGAAPREPASTASTASERLDLGALDFAALNAEPIDAFVVGADAHSSAFEKAPEPAADRDGRRRAADGFIVTDLIGALTGL